MPHMVIVLNLVDDGEFKLSMTQGSTGLQPASLPRTRTAFIRTKHKLELDKRLELLLTVYETVVLPLYESSKKKTYISSIRTWRTYCMGVAPEDVYPKLTWITEPAEA